MVEFVHGKRTYVCSITVVTYFLVVDTHMKDRSISMAIEKGDEKSERLGGVELAITVIHTDGKMGSIGA